MKICNKCKVPKDESEFSKASSRKDGLFSSCKACDKVRRGLRGADGLTNNQRGAAKIGADGLTKSQRWYVKLGADGLTNPQRNNAKVGADGLTNQQRGAKKIGADGLNYQQRRKAKNPRFAREAQLKLVYGISIEDFDRMLAEQGGACAICKDTDRKWHVDHCHTTGKVRAVLCPGCNTAIGLLGDSARLVSAAAEYLTKHGSL